MKKLNTLRLFQPCFLMGCHVPIFFNSSSLTACHWGGGRPQLIFGACKTFAAVRKKKRTTSGIFLFKKKIKEVQNIQILFLKKSKHFRYSKFCALYTRAA